jgi:hypothetical protein
MIEGRNCMNKFLIRIAFVMLVLFLSGCSSSVNSVQLVSDQFVSGLEIPEMTSSLGSMDDQSNEQVLSYTFTLVNTNIYDVEIQWVEPVLSSELSGTVTTHDLRALVDQSLQPGEVLEIAGQFNFSTEGMTKNQILELEPFITEMRIASEASLPLPAVNIQ